MICRAPVLTETNLNDLYLIVRYNWVQALHEHLNNALKFGRSEVDILTMITEVTDLFKPVQDPLVLWGFQLRVQGVGSVRTLMKPALYEEYLNLAKNTKADFETGSLSADAQKKWDDFETGREALVKALEEAPAVDPELLDSTQIPSGKDPQVLN